MEATCSVQKGPGNIRHNFDIEYRIEKGYRVREVENIVLKEEKIEDVYHRLFDKQVEEYNSHQTREDRKITDYYEKIKSSKKTNTFNEIIISVGSMDDGVPDDVKVSILKQAYEAVTEKYQSNIEVFNAVIHLDEMGTPHMHLDYVAYVDNENAKNGLTRKINQDAAYKAMGFKPEKSYINGHDKKPIIFNGFRNDIVREMEKIYAQHNLEIYHVKAGKGHMEIQDFKDSKTYDELIQAQEEHLKQLEEQLETRQQQLDNLLSVEVEEDLSHEVEIIEKGMPGFKEKLVHFEDFEKTQNQNNQLKEQVAILRSQKEVLQESKKELDKIKSTDLYQENIKLKSTMSAAAQEMTRLKEMTEYLSNEYNEVLAERNSLIDNNYELKQTLQNHRDFIDKILDNVQDFAPRLYEKLEESFNYVKEHHKRQENQKLHV